MWDLDKDDLRQRYQARWKTSGYESRSLGWDKDCQWVRFEAAFEGLRADEYRTIVDLGCGFGDLLGFLREKNWDGTYLGVDLVPEFIEEARKRFGSDSAAEFLCEDFQTLKLPSKRNLAIAIGVFNHRLHENNFEFIRRAIDVMWALTDKVVICDFLSDTADVNHRRDDLYYADPSELYRLASACSRRVNVNHAYMPFECQIKIWHEQSFEKSAPVFPPYAHLASAQTQWRINRTSRDRSGL